VYYLIYGYLNLVDPEESNLVKKSLHHLEKLGITPNSELGSIFIRFIEEIKYFFYKSKNQEFGDNLKVFYFDSLENLHNFLIENKIKKKDFHVFKVIKGDERKITIKKGEIKEENLPIITKENIESAIKEYQEMEGVTK